MKKAKKISIILAMILIVAGIAVSAAAFAVIDGDFTRLTVMVEKTYPVEEPFDNVFVHSEFTNVEFKPSENGKCYVVSNQYQNLDTTVEIQDNTLQIRQTDNRKWHDSIGFFFADPIITIYLPETEYEDLSIGMVNGDVLVPKEFQFADAMINTIRGDVHFSAAVEHGFSSETVFGVITLTGVNAEEISCKTEQYDIYLWDCDANGLELTTVNGNVEGTLLSGKTFVVDAANGEVDVPDTTGGGTCEISTINGDVKIKMK